MLLNHIIRHKLKPTVIIPRRYSLRNKLRPVPQEQDIGKHQLQVKSGPLYGLVRPKAVYNFTRDSAGNVLMCIKSLHEAMAYKKDFEVTEYFYKMQKKLENYRKFDSNDYRKLKQFLINKGFYGAAYKLLLNFMVFIVEHNPQHVIHKRILLDISNAFLSNTLEPQLRNLVNYRLALEMLESRDYFGKLNPKEIIQIVHKPFITPFKKSNYLQRVQSMEHALDFIDMNSDDNNSHSSLLNMVKPDLIETLGLAIESMDTEKVDLFWEALNSNYSEFRPEEFHNLFNKALQTSEYEIILRLLSSGKFSKIAQEISGLQKVQLARLYASKGDIDGFMKVFKYNKFTNTSLEKSEIVEVFYNCDLPFHDVFKLIDFLSSENELLVTRDYEFLVKWIAEPLSKAPALQILDVVDSFDFDIIQKLEIGKNVKVLYMNLYLKAITKATNISGVINAYCQLPLHLVNLETFQIVLNSLSSNPMKNAAVSSELFRFAHNYCKLKFTPKEYAILINNCINKGREDFEIKQLVYYLYHYFTKLETKELDNRIYDLVHIEKIDSDMREIQATRNNRSRSTKYEDIARVLLANDKKILHDPVDLVDSLLTRDVINSMEKHSLSPDISVEEYFERYYDPVDKDYQNPYDAKDAARLRKRHDLYIDAIEV